MFKNKRRCIAVLLSIFILSGSIITAYDKAYASDIIIGGGVVVTTGEAIAFLLGAFGLTAASAAVYANSDSIKAWGNERLEAFKEFSHGQTAITQEQFDARLPAWLTNAQKGIIDTSSVVWDYWRQWAGQLTTETITQTGGSVGLPAYAALASDPAIIDAFKLNLNTSDTTYVVAIYQNNNGIRYFLITLSESFFRYTYYSTYYNHTYEETSKSFPFNYDGSTYHYEYSTMYLSDRETDFCTVFGLNTSELPKTVSSSGKDVIPDFFIDNVLGADSPVESEYALVDTGITDVYNRDKDYAAVDWVNPGAVAGATDVVIDWGKVGDMTTVLEGVAEGVLDPADILDDAGVTVIDKVTDKVIDNTGVTDIPVTDVVVDTSEIGDYTMPGLESLFPFCLPFDLIAFIKVLQAEPVAPHFKIPIKYPTLGGTMAEYEVDIDFSAFDTVAALLRDMECLLFIVGLIILTRDKMIRG